MPAVRPMSQARQVHPSKQAVPSGGHGPDAGLFEAVVGDVA
jgi:hypothetical protein